MKFKRIVNIMKNNTKKPENYQRYITIPMNITRKLNLKKGDTICVNVLSVERTSKAIGGTSKDIGVMNALREKYRSPNQEVLING